MLISSESFAQAIDQIYAAALDPSLWPTAMAAIDCAVGGRGGLLGIDAAGRPGFLSVTGYDQQAITSFASHYASKSYVWGLLPTTAEGVMIHDRRVMSPDQRRRDVFANEWATQCDTTDCVVLPLLKRADRTAFAVFARSPACGEFEGPELDFIRRLAPHLRRAAQLRVELDRSGVDAAQALEAIDKLDDGVIFATADGVATRLNSAAERLLATTGSGLFLRQGRLCCASSALTSNLRRLVAQAAGLAGERQAGVLTIQREQQSRPLTAFCIPLGEARPWSFDLQPSVMLLLGDMTNPRSAPAELLRDLFGLTQAEARVAVRLAAGVNLTETADELGVAKSTVISQLNAIFQKTQTNRQGELIRLLNALPRISTVAPRYPLAQAASA